MIQRDVHLYIRELLDIFPAVVLIGPRQVGKTTLCRVLADSQDRKVVFLDMEKAEDAAKLSEPSLYLAPYADHLVVIDEIQGVPDLFPELRAIIDDNLRPGRFLITGSASPDLLRQSAETLAGRVAFVELSPLTAMEVDDLDSLWLRGGFPLSYLAGSERKSTLWRKMFVSTFLERDLPRLGFTIPPRQMGQLWEMIAHLQGQLLNASKLAANFGVTSPTIKRHLAILEGALVIRSLYPYAANVKKRLVKAPKIYIRDSGLLHSLLRVHTREDLFGHPQIGVSYEGWVIEQIISSLADKDYHFYFYRTHAGAEVDLLVDTGNSLIPVEIKRSTSPQKTRGFKQVLADLGCDRGYFIYPGEESYQQSDDCECLNLIDFINRLRNVKAEKKASLIPPRGARA